MWIFERPWMRLTLALWVVSVGATAWGSANAAVPEEHHGTIEIQTEDYESRSVTRRFLRTSGQRIELRSSATHTDLRSGAHVRVKGWRSGDLLYLADDPGAVVEESTAVRSTESTLSATTGEQRVGVILVNFEDNRTQPMTASAADDLVFGEVATFYWENSFGQTWFTGDTWGWYTIPLSSTTCDTERIASDANAAASAAGADLSRYSRMIYIFPPNACGWAGAGSSGNTPTRVFINGLRGYSVVAHEMGHAMGLLHAQGLDCDNAILADACTVRSYGDPADVMGAGKGHFNAYHKERLGWIGQAQPHGLTEVTASGVYRVLPYAAAETGSKGLRVYRGRDPSTGLDTWFYVEYRTATGFDAAINETSGSNLIDNVMVHMGAPGDLSSVLFLDMTPGSDLASWSHDFRDGALTVGATFEDAASGVKISLVGVDSTGATVAVTTGNSVDPCSHRNPTVGLTAPTQSVLAGASVSYVLTLTSNDTSSCAASYFDLSSSVPAGWNASLGLPGVTLGPGQSASTSLVVTSSATASEGTYLVTATARNSGFSSYSGLASATLQVVSGSTGGSKGGKSGGGKGGKPR